jgi:hypothetical protein
MNKKIVHKVPQGKMLRIEADIDGSIIKEIKITGDFLSTRKKLSSRSRIF